MHLGFQIVKLEIVASFLLMLTKNIVVAGSSRIVARYALEAELIAMDVRLKIATDYQRVADLKQTYSLSITDVEAIPRDWHILALAMHGRTCHVISLFH